MKSISFRSFLSVAVLALVTAAVYLVAPPPRSANAAEQAAPLTFSKTYDPASLVDGAGATTTVTASSGIALGDYCMASFGVDLASVMLTCYVSAANTVSVRFQNESTGTVDLASSTLRVLVFRKQPNT